MALRDIDGYIGASPIGGASNHLASAVVDFLLACRPEWHADAACVEHPELSWFDADQAEATAAICRRCSVAGDCGAYAVENGVNAGMWAGVVRDPPRRKRPPVVASDGPPPAWVAAERAERARIEKVQNRSSSSPSETVAISNGFRPAAAGVVRALPDAGEERRRAVQELGASCLLTRSDPGRSRGHSRLDQRHLRHSHCPSLRVRTLPPQLVHPPEGGCCETVMDMCAPWFEGNRAMPCQEGRGYYRRHQSGQTSAGWKPHRTASSSAWRSVRPL